MIDSSEQTNEPTRDILAQVRSEFGDRFIASRTEAEREALDLLDARAGALTVDAALHLGQLFNRHEIGGRQRQDRFSPGFTGAVWLKVTEDIDRFNQAVAELWTAPLDKALETLGHMYADRSQLPGAGSSLPSMLLYLRDPDRFGICINATMRGLGYAVGSDFRADSRDSYLSFCDALRGWRERHGIAPQEADAVLTALMRTIPTGSGTGTSVFVFGGAASRFLADLALKQASRA